MEATPITEKISIDGKLVEAVWQTAPFIANFTQRDLNFGQPASERTKVALLYDKNNIYVGVWCYQRQMEKVTVKYLQRDFNYSTDDNFEIIICPFNDNRNGYLFIINPNGARADVQVSGDNDNIDWNGVWDARTSSTDSGWFAEIQIPFNNLQFKKDNIKSWSVNFERNIRYKKEQDRRQGWSRGYNFENLRYEGILTGIRE